jgi:hypothetical protein
MFAALLVVGVYWVYGFVLIYWVTIVTRFIWMKYFKLAFYLPAIFTLVYLYVFKKKMGLFSESLTFLLSLTLVILFTLELIAFL